MQRPHYTGDIIKVLREAEMVVEGLYPLLSRLYKDGLLNMNGRSLNSLPPRKYIMKQLNLANTLVGS